MSAYGDKRDYRKINLYVQLGKSDAYVYQGSTTWAATCKEAKARFLLNNPQLKPEQVAATYM